MSLYSLPRGVTLLFGLVMMASSAAGQSSDAGEARETQALTASPAPYLGYSRTLGVELGARLAVQPQTSPRALPRWHAEASARVALGSGGVRGRLAGMRRGMLGPIDGRGEVTGQTAGYYRLFFGLGNGTPEVPDDSARVPFAQLAVEAGFGRLGRTLQVVAGPTWQQAQAERFLEGRLVPSLTSLPPEATMTHAHAGLYAKATLDRTHTEGSLRRGLRAHLRADWRAVPLTESATPYGVLSGEMSKFTPVVDGLVLAVRAGGSHRLGSYPFFDASTLGTNTALRGYSTNRFAGRSALFLNVEARARVMDLSDLASAILARETRAVAGVLAFVDQGRVWTDAPHEPGTLHRSAGLGAWGHALGLLGSATVAASSERLRLSAGFGFQF